MIFTIGPFSQKPKHPVVITSTLSAIPFSSRSLFRLSAMSWLDDALHPVPPQIKICKCCEPRAKPQLCSATFSLLSSRRRSAVSALFLIFSRSWIESIFIRTKYKFEANIAIRFLIKKDFMRNIKKKVKWEGICALFRYVCILRIAKWVYSYH